MASGTYTTPDDIGTKVPQHSDTIMSPSTPHKQEWDVQPPAQQPQSASTSQLAKTKGLTPLPPVVDISLAILTCGLSVPVFHVVEGVAERKRLKRASKSKAVTSKSDLENLSQPSTIVQNPSAIPSEPTELDPAPVKPKSAELDSSPATIRDQPPPYAARDSSSSTNAKHRSEPAPSEIYELPAPV